MASEAPARWLLAQEWLCEWCGTKLINLRGKRKTEECYVVLGYCKHCRADLLHSKPIHCEVRDE